MKTKSEKLLAKIGHLALCDGCGKKKKFTKEWMMDKSRNIYCPSCLKTLRGKAVVSI